MYDAVTYHRMATERMAELQAERRKDALAALATCCTSAATRVARRTGQVRAAAGRRWSATVSWLRSGQLGPGYVRDCCT